MTTKTITPENPPSTTTPLMKQYQSLKNQAKDAFLFFRMGDFYEFFGKDAEKAAPILNIALTTRDKNKKNPMPMAGVPHHSVQGYIQKLLKAGYKIAIADQCEDPKQTKGIVKRKITRFYTPAIHFNPESADPFFFATLKKSTQNPSRKKSQENSETLFFLALIEVTTGEGFFSEALSFSKVKEQLATLPIQHLCYLENTLSKAQVQSLKSFPFLLESLPEHFLHPEKAQMLLKTHFSIANANVFFPQLIQAETFALALFYILNTQKLTRLPHLKRPEPLQKKEHLDLGPLTLYHLHVLPTMEERSSLLSFLNQAKSPLGKRTLRSWLCRPLKDLKKILLRQDQVKAFLPHALEQVHPFFRQISDLERILTKIHAKLATPKDTFQIGTSLQNAHQILLSPLFQTLIRTPHHALSALLKDFQKQITTLCSLEKKILSSQLPPPPLSTREGNIFHPHIHPELQKWSQLKNNSQTLLKELEQKERSQTGISSLKIKYSRVFGYTFEVTRSHLQKVPSYFIRRQSMTHAERFVTEALKKLEKDILEADEKLCTLGEKLFSELCETIASHANLLSGLSQTLGTLEALLVLAQRAQQPGWVFPTLDHSFAFSVQESRHPLLDQDLNNRFVPNSFSFDQEKRIAIVTGPNMGGKSTLMRQLALLVLLGQMGSPIPAQKAHWGLFDGIYTRMGAQDFITQGQSTFMVEMSELSTMLHRATERSLLVIDEMGRGTSTYDGISVAWATLEWLSTTKPCRTFFSTHYHELTELDRKLPRIQNIHLKVKEQILDSGEHQLQFLYTIAQGPSNRSFGIQVASLAGLPSSILKRAWEVLKDLQQNTQKKQKSTQVKQENIFSLFQKQKSPKQKKAEKLLEKLESIQPETLSPLDALQLVFNWKKNLNKGNHSGQEKKLSENPKYIQN